MRPSEREGLPGVERFPQNMQRGLLCSAGEKRVSHMAKTPDLVETSCVWIGFKDFEPQVHFSPCFCLTGDSNPYHPAFLQSVMM